MTEDTFPSHIRAEAPSWTPLPGLWLLPVHSTPSAKNYRRGRSYCNSLVTICCVLLAWARALMPVWVRISYFDMSEVAEA